jgi:tetratricopeptide (TPR) repeat protein
MRTPVLITLALISIQAFAQPEKKYVRKGNSNYRDGNFQQAEVEYRKALEKEPDSYKADYNLANALYKQKQYEAAAGRYAALAEKETDKENQGRYYYNLGNTHYENKKFKESIEAYKMALRNNPADADAKHNLQLALRMLNEQQQQENQQGKGKENNEKNQDQQNQQNQQDQDQQNQQNNQDQQNQQSNEDQQNQDQQNNQPQQLKGQISPADAERILQALENEEKEVMKRVQDRKEQVSKVPVEKNW